jgi:DNA-binding transcriptional MerR regulator
MASGYRIGEMATKAGISADALRYYERLGVLPRVGRTSSGLRRYGDDVRARNVPQLLTDRGRPQPAG